MPEGNLHAYAVQAEQNVEKLATGLAQAGADPGTVKVVSQIADVLRKIIKALGKGQEVSGDQEPPAQEQPAPPPQEPPQQPARPRTIQDATAELHQETQRPRT
jgi:hypothetical protein